MANCEAWETHLKGRPNDANAKRRRNDLIRYIRCRLGIKAVVEQARCIFLRKRGIGIEPEGEEKPLTRSHLGFLAARSSDYAMDYLSGHRPAEAVWQTVGEYVQTVARMIADREGQSRPPAAVRMMIPDCDVRRPELIG
ncbi:hypothetical protein K6L44_06435 [Gluconacetobacter entanii]|uniref:hypothetical protein n=1 Tax=Gluconacetobacter entanii TaxID=108528 RepID=UPI001C936D47|nr:hypothetical protein [Gluconacetobacter entanii]MBY4639638.1 hypothetical protein [Gluconacetobacter entanii]MCW4579665.1 hypothetical protein [Gluconacetobacter entanii]MCW4583070.1 hypothetical protein [Gluconacetobacter entanii]MCW4586425.1 hypothetical protein [Gluconacetobacter entanii]